MALASAPPRHPRPPRRAHEQEPSLVRAAVAVGTDLVTGWLRHVREAFTVVEVVPVPPMVPISGVGVMRQAYQGRLAPMESRRMLVAARSSSGASGRRCHPSITTSPR